MKGEPHQISVGIAEGGWGSSTPQFDLFVCLGGQKIRIGRIGSVGESRDSQLFEVPPIISGTGKATNFNFCTHILSIDRNKSLLQISEKVAGCVVRTFKTFQGTHILGASRGLLCDSSAVLLKSSK